MMRLAWQDARRQARRVDPRLAGAVVLLGVLAGLAASSLPAPDPDAGLFTVAEPSPSVWHDAVAADARFRFVAAGEDLTIAGDGVRAAATPRGQAALAAFVEAAATWQEERLLAEPDQAAAFPVLVDIDQVPRTTTGGGTQRAGPPGDGDGGEGPGAGPGEAGEAPGEGPGGPGGDERPEDGNRSALPLGPDARTALRPSQLDPPFPIRSLLLTFAYVLPASLLMQVHAANLHAERVRHRGTALLATPLSPLQIIAGKTLPFAALLLVLDVVVTVALGAGVLAFLAAACVLAFLLAATSFVALAASNLRELTMLNVGLTTGLNVFLFLPAMFPALPPVAYLSPMHVVAVDIQGGATAWAAMLYATLPLTLAAVALAALAVGLMREEGLFGTRRLHTAVAAVTRNRPRLLLAGALAVPFAMAAELLLFVILTVLSVPVAIVLFLPAAVLVETAAKAAACWPRASALTPRRALIGGLLVGAGFFLAEKTALVVGLVGFADLPFGREALALLGSGTGLLVLAAPLALHGATGAMLAVAASRRLRTLGFAAALGVHGLYDAWLIGGVL